jgi:hypothetical protein
MRSALVALLFVGCGAAAIIDRIELLVGRHAITEIELEQEIRITSFFNSRAPDNSIAGRRAAAQRLLQQALLRREMELARFPQPEASTITQALGQIRSGFASEQEFSQALQSRGLTVDLLKEHLARQISSLQFIEYRFRPNLSISDADLNAAYREEVEHWLSGHKGAAAPSFEQLKPILLTRLLESRTDEALDRWLSETAQQVTILYVDETLEPAGGTKSYGP